MQEENGSRKNFIDRMTLGAIRRYSRRGLLGNLGQKGLILASAVGLSAVGAGIDTSLANASTNATTSVSVSFNHSFEADPENAGCLKVPPPCIGPCSNTRSTCTTGGARCTVTGSHHRAHGSFDCLGHFHCTAIDC